MKTIFILILSSAITFASYADEIRVKNAGKNDSHFAEYIISVDSVEISTLYEFNILVSQDDFDYLLGIVESYKYILDLNDEIMEFGSFRIDHYINSKKVSTVKLNSDFSLEFFIELLCIAKEYKQNSVGLIFLKGTIKRLI